MKKVFDCKNCGECCKDFGIGNYLPLFEWEAEQYKELAKQKGVGINIKPIDKHYFLDKKSGIVFSIKFGMFNMPCPFLKDNKCIIYNERALSCRAFPIAFTPKFAPNKIFSPACFLKCPNFNNKESFNNCFKISEEPRQIQNKEIEDYLKKTYGEIYDYALQQNFITDFMFSSLDGYIKDKKIKLRKISKFDIENYKVIPFLEFFERKGFMDSNARKYLIEIFRDKAKFKQFLNQNG